MPILRAQLSYLHYITPISNLKSIREHGILSHNAAARFTHDSVAMQAIQDRRAARRVPAGMRLHDYVNLFFDARTPMMWVRKERHASICVLEVSSEVLDLPGVVVTDGNASSDYTLFMTSERGLRSLDAERVYAERWTHPDQIEQWRRASARSAEVLVPSPVSPNLIQGITVSCEASEDLVKTELANPVWKLPLSRNAHLFFQS